MLNIQKIAEEIIKSTKVASDEPTVGKSDDEDTSGIKKLVHANSYEACLIIQKLVSPANIDEAVKVAKELEELVIIDSERIPYAMEHSNLKVGDVKARKSYDLVQCSGNFYVYAYITIKNGGSTEDALWGLAAIEIAKKFGYKT